MKSVRPDLFENRGINRRYLRLPLRVADIRLLLKLLQRRVEPVVVFILAKFDALFFKKNAYQITRRSERVVELCNIEETTARPKPRPLTVSARSALPSPTVIVFPNRSSSSRTIFPIKSRCTSSSG